MNRLNWHKVEKVKIVSIKRGLLCLQFILENRSVRNTFIKNGEFEKSIVAIQRKKQQAQFYSVPSDLLAHLASTN